MAAYLPLRGRIPVLRGRRGECGALDRLVEAVRAGASRVLVVRGEPGVGKTALLDYLAGRAPGCRVVRAAGVETEMEFAFAGLHQLCAPMLDHLDRLPVPQREALRTAFGISAGPAPSRFFIGLAVLDLLSAVAEERPLVCVVDDEQWLDRASAQVLGFVARRLAAESVGLVFAARVPDGEVAGVPELLVEGLREDDARALFDSALAGPVDARVRDRIVAETRGNPLALLELARGVTPAELAGGFGLPSVVPLAGRIEEGFRRRVEALPAQTRRLLQLAAADPTGEPAVVWRAARRLGIPAEAATPAAELSQPGLRRRVRRLRRDAQTQRRPPHQRPVTRRISRCQRQQPPRLVRQRRQLAGEAVFDPARQRRRAGQPEPARQLRRAQAPWQLQQRQRITPGLRHDQVGDPRVQRPGQRRGQQRPRILLAQPGHFQLGQPGQLRPRVTGREHHPDRVGGQPPRRKPQRLHRRPVQPLHVIDHADQRAVPGHLRQQAEHGKTDKKTVRRRPSGHAERGPQRIMLRPRDAAGVV